MCPGTPQSGGCLAVIWRAHLRRWELLPRAGIGARRRAGSERILRLAGLASIAMRNLNPFTVLSFCYPLSNWLAQRSLMSCLRARERLPNRCQATISPNSRRSSWRSPPLAIREIVPCRFSRSSVSGQRSRHGVVVEQDRCCQFSNLAPRLSFRF